MDNKITKSTSEARRLIESKSITIEKNNVIYVKQKNKELGYVGNPTKVDVKLINSLIKENKSTQWGYLLL